MGWLFDKALELGGKFNDRITFGSPTTPQDDSDESILEKVILREAERYGNRKQGIPDDHNIFEHRNIRNRKGENHRYVNMEPAYGAPVYCDLLAGAGEHSGIYVGGRTIVNLEGSGKVTMVSPSKFTNSLTTSVKDIWMPVDADSGQPIGFNVAANWANDLHFSGYERTYNLLLDNCHQFTAGCITENFDNADNDLWMLKRTIEEFYGGQVRWVKWIWNR